MSETPEAGPASGPPNEPARRTVSRLVGVAIASITAVIAFAAGSVLFPAPASAPPTVALLPPPPLPPPLPPPPVDAGTAGDATPEDLSVASNDDSRGATPAESPTVAADVKFDRGETSDSDKPRTERASKKKRGSKSDAPTKGATPDSGTSGSDAGGDVKGDNLPLPPSDGTANDATGDPGKDSTADCQLVEKDMARESWRRNWPTICPIASTGKAFILIPIKGPIEGETHHLSRRPTREARIVLPEGAESQLTMKQYKVRRLGFKELRINATEEGGTRLRVKLQPGAGDPVFEIKDGYAKITVAMPDKN